MQSVLCSSIWHIFAFLFLWNSKPEALKRKSHLRTEVDIVDIRTKIESLFVKNSCAIN